MSNSPLTGTPLLPLDSRFSSVKRRPPTEECDSYFSASDRWYPVVDDKQRHMPKTPIGIPKAILCSPKIQQKPAPVSPHVLGLETFAAVTSSSPLIPSGASRFCPKTVLGTPPRPLTQLPPAPRLKPVVTNDIPSPMLLCESPTSYLISQ